MFKRGAFVYNPMIKILYIARNTTEGKLVAHSPGGFYIESTPSLTFHAQVHRLATQTEIELYRGGRMWPDWVQKILVDPSNSPATLPLTPQGYVDPKPRKIMPIDSLHGHMTLQTFQDRCVHRFETYTGFSRVYKYCVICDKKENF